MNKIDELIKALESHDYQVSQDAKTELVALGPAIIRPLLSAMCNGAVSPMNVGSILGQLGRDGAMAIAHLIESGNPTARRSAAEALSWVSPNIIPISIIKKHVKDSDAVVRKHTVVALGRSGSEAVIASLIQGSQDVESEVREEAARALGELGISTAQVRDRLIVLTRDPNPAVRAAAIVSLSNTGYATPDSVPLYSEALNDSDSNVRQMALGALWKCAEYARGLIPRVVGMLGDPDWRVRAYAIETIERLGANDTAIEDVLAKAMKDSHARVRWVALLTLWRMRGRSDLVVPALAEVVRRAGECDESVCDLARQIGPDAKPLVPMLIRELEKIDYHRRWAAAEALLAIGQGAHEAIPSILQLLRGDNGNVASILAPAIEKMGEWALPALINALDSKETEIRKFAIDRLGVMGKGAAIAVPRLLEILETDYSEEVRYWAAIALGEIGGNEKALPILLKGLRSEDAAIRQRSARSLGRIGKGAKLAITPLRQLAKYGAEDIRKEALEALRRIDKE